MLTDPDRVGRQAEAYLGRLLGGEVTVEKAALSLFEGLRLEGVRVSAAGDGPSAAGDDLIFTARLVQIDYDPLRLLRGDLQASRVLAVDPHVHLSEDPHTGRWNFQRLGGELADADGAPPAAALDLQDLPPLPRIILRNARVDYTRLEEGRLVPRGTAGVEAQLLPVVPDEAGSRPYRFAVQTLGLAGPDPAGGPQAWGTFDLARGRVDAQVTGLDFESLVNFLPVAISGKLTRYDIRGRADVPQLRLTWPTDDDPSPATFRVTTRLDGGTLDLQPLDWLGDGELAARAVLRSGLDRLAPRAGRFGTAARSASSALEVRPIRLEGVRGQVVLAESGVRVNGLVGEVAGMRLRVDGIVGGYSPDAPASVVVQNVGNEVVVPGRLEFASSLPLPVREVYTRLFPSGRARLRLELHRPQAAPGQSARPTVGGHVDVLDGRFTLDRFPYPLTGARGRLLIRPDRDAGAGEELVIDDLHGTGRPGGPNADTVFRVDGRVAPLDGTAGFDVVVRGEGVRHEDALMAALPEEARAVLGRFGPLDAESSVDFTGDFEARVARDAGPDQPWRFGVDMDVTSFRGRFDDFPYPLRGAAGRIEVREDHVRLAEISITPDAVLGGRIDWGKRPGDPESLADRPVRLDLRLRGSRTDLDADTFAALPAEVAGTLRSLGVGGSGAVDARIYTDDLDRLAWDVRLDLAGGRFWPTPGTFAVSDVTGRIRVTPTTVELDDVSGTRGGGRVGVSGRILLDQDRADVVLTARNLAADGALYGLLPAAARDAYDWVRPSGRFDATVSLVAPLGVLRGDADADPGDVRFAADLRPQSLDVDLRGFPYPLTDVRGRVRVEPDRVTLDNVTASRRDTDAPSDFAVSGVGVIEGQTQSWQLQPSFRNLPADDALLEALPEVLADLLRDAAVAGHFDGDVTVLQIDLDAAEVRRVGFDAGVVSRGAQFDVGLPLSDVEGALRVAGVVLGEASGTGAGLRELSGDFRADRFLAGGRPGSDLRGVLRMAPVESPDAPRTLAVDDLVSTLCDGTFAGQIRLTLPPLAAPDGATRYGAELAVRDADVALVLGEQGLRQLGQDVGGRLTARLDLQGIAGDPASRRGRGDVRVEGRRLYHLPLVVGLLQVTNLSLPIAEPFREAETSFSLDAGRVVFDRISLRAADMRMNGTGEIDFDRRTVDLTFSTSNRRWVRIPVVGDLLTAAGGELLRVRVRGTLDNPEVRGRTLPTVTTTIDEVLRGG